jgi:hypothetical protein
MLSFLSFHADEAGTVRRLEMLEREYSRLFYGGNGGNGRKRFYEHLAMVKARGYLYQIDQPRHLAGEREYRKAVYRLAFPLAELPAGLPLDLRMHLQVAERHRDPEAGLAPVTVVGRTPSKTAETAVPQPESAAITDPAAAAKARYLAIEPWLDDAYLVAAAMRVEQLADEAAGREFDEQAAETRARIRLHAVDEDDDRYAVVDERELQALAAAPAEGTKPQPRQLILRDPDTSRYSREGSLPFSSSTHYWLDLRKQGRKAKTPPTARTLEVGPVERRRAGALVRDRIWQVWHQWAQADPAHRAPLSAGQWEDLTCTIALALRRATPSAVVEECTRSLGSARSLANVVGSRLWALVRQCPEWPEWADWRRSLMRAAEPSWNLPTPPGVIGPASARAELDRSRGGTQRIGVQLALVGLAPSAARYAEEARAAVGTAALGLERYRYGEEIPDTDRPGLADVLAASSAAAQAIAAAQPPPESPDARAAREAAEAAYRAKCAAERAANWARAQAEGKRSRKERGVDERRFNKRR